MMILPTADHVLAMSEIENAKGFFKALPYFSDAMRADYPKRFYVMTHRNGISTRVRFDSFYHFSRVSNNRVGTLLHRFRGALSPLDPPAPAV